AAAEFACHQGGRPARDPGGTHGLRRAGVSSADDVHAYARRTRGTHRRRPRRGRSTDPCTPSGAAALNTLVVAEQRAGRVLEVTYELISAAAELGGSVTVASIGANPDTPNLDRAGVDEIVLVRTEQTEFETDVYLAALERLIDQRTPDVVLLAFTA